MPSATRPQPVNSPPRVRSYHSQLITCLFDFDVMEKGGRADETSGEQERVESRDRRGRAA